jgi:2-methylcitrate dehydratase
MSDRVSRVLAASAIGTPWERVPPETIHEVRRRILDSLGAAIAALDEGAPTAARRYALGLPGASTVWGTGARADAEAAGFANGVAVRSLDLNDTYLSREPLHPSDAIAALLALAEARDLPSRELLRAIAIAYEIGASLCDAASLRAHGWDHVAFLAIAVACGAGAMLGLEAARIEHAISLATVPHAPMRRTRSGQLSMWKGAAAAGAAKDAVHATLLAEAGMDAPEAPFEGTFGFVQQLLGGEGFDPEPLRRLERVEPPVRILDTHVKAWPVEYHAQSAVDAALRLRADLGDPSRIGRIRIETFRAAHEIIAADPEKWDPRTRETADHSLPYVVCAALQDGEVTRSTFELARIRRPDTLELVRDRTTVEEDRVLTARYPGETPNRITVTTTDGLRLVHEVAHPHGHARDPMTDAELVAKFRSNVAGRIDEDRAARIEEAVWSLDREGGLGALTRELGA